MNTQQHNGRVLIVDDETIAVENLEHVLTRAGYRVTAADTGEAGLEALRANEFDVVMTDLRMEKVDGMAILNYCKSHHPDTEVIMITGHATVSSAVDAMREGAFHYLAKPFRLDEVRHLVSEAMELGRLKRDNRTLRELVEAQTGRVRIVTQDAAMQRLLETARQIAPSDCSIIITGESGTGKELLARYIHACSERGGRPFVAVNCGAFSEELLTNELFGHEKGAYTGAHQARAGLIESADGGTLFLDEITEMSPAMQVKLLRVIQEQEVLRLGSTQPVAVDVRYLAASNRDLNEAVASGRFRQDLYYRLKVVNLHLPPLNERRGDVPLLAYHFLKTHAALMDKPVKDIAPETMALLVNYPFPGNVRELSNLIERGVALARGEMLEPAHLPEELRGAAVDTPRAGAEPLPTLEAQEKDYIRWVLEQTGGNRTRAAAILGIDRVSLWRKIKKYAL